jgi:hypothetical protein
MGCAIEYSRKQSAKKEAKDAKIKRQEYREAKVKAKSRGQWLKEAQVVINRYVRLRDSKLGCVSCDKPATWNGQWHASHFRSVGAASSVRFNLWNIHKSCSVCNNWKSGNLSEYEPRLRAKIGDEKVNWLRTQNKLSNYQTDYLKRLIDIFKRKIKYIEKRSVL